MKWLLDTHIALWATIETRKLPEKALVLMSAADSELFVSAVSVWEIAVKYALRRGRPDDMPLSGGEARTVFENAGFSFLPLSTEHAVAVDGLPRHHADPFDRLLIAQVSVEPMRLVTRDRDLAAYGAMVMPV